MKHNININAILEKYWEGETSVEEEKVLRSYFASGNIDKDHKVFADLFGYFASQEKIVLPAGFVPKSEETQTPAANVFTLKKFILAIAAIFILVMSSIFLMKNISTRDNQVNVSQVQEIDDPDEALRVTKQALALVSKKFNKSKRTVKENMGALEKASIFK